MVKIRLNIKKKVVINNIYFLLSLLIKEKNNKHPKDFPKNTILPKPPNSLEFKSISFAKASVELDKMP